MNGNQPLGYDPARVCRWANDGQPNGAGDGLCVCVGPNPSQLVIGSIKFIPTTQYTKRSLANDSTPLSRYRRED